jgi:hypothetical protein
MAMYMLMKPLLVAFLPQLEEIAETKDALMVASRNITDGRTGNLSLKHIESFKADDLKFAIKKTVSNRS